MKGIHRNLILHAVAASIDTESSEELDDFERPVESVRWMWGQKNGLVRVRRYSRRNERTGKYVKKQEVDLLGKPIKDPAKIAEVMFRGKAGPDALNSVETVIDAVKKAYKKSEQDKIFSDTVKAFKNHHSDEELASMKMPKELKQFV